MKYQVNLYRRTKFENGMRRRYEWKFGKAGGEDSVGFINSLATKYIDLSIHNPSYL